VTRTCCSSSSSTCQLAGSGGELGAADGEVLLPVGGVHVQVALLDAPHQRAGENLGAMPRLDLGGGQGLAVGAPELAFDHLHQFHHHGQAGQGLLTRGGVQGLLDDTAETVVERAPARGVVTAEADNDG
jgi:hypothetical protein